MNTEADFGRMSGAACGRIRRPWRAARPLRGERVIGYVGNDIPVALILAAGRAARATARHRRAPAPRAPTASSKAPSRRSCAPSRSSGCRATLDHLDAVIFARGDDSGQRLYYYLCELQRRGLCARSQAAALRHRHASRARRVSNTRSTRRGCSPRNSARAASKLERGAAARARSARNCCTPCRRAALLPAPLRGSAAWSCEFAAGCDWRDDFDDARPSVARRRPRCCHLPRRVMLAGDPPPDDQMHVAIEACGASVVLELTESRSRGERTRRDPLSGNCG